jgi:hypothetical protein
MVLKQHYFSGISLTAFIVRMAVNEIKILVDYEEDSEDL